MSDLMDLRSRIASQIKPGAVFFLFDNIVIETIQHPIQPLKRLFKEEYKP